MIRARNASLSFLDYDHKEKDSTEGETPTRKTMNSARQPEHLRRLTKQISFVESRSRDASSRTSFSDGDDFSPAPPSRETPRGFEAGLKNRRKSSPATPSLLQITTPSEAR